MAHSDLTIIHSADLHGRLTRAQAEWLGGVKRQRAALLLDCGDALLAPNLFALPWPEAAPVLLDLAGCDAICVGNREFAMSRRGLHAKWGRFTCPLLSANLIPRPGLNLPLRRSLILDRPDGRRLGLFGLSQPIIDPGSVWERACAARYVDPWLAAGDVIAELRPQVDLLIALTHFGRCPEAELAERFPALDLILCGHWHAARPSLEVIGRTAISRTFHHARGAVILTLDDQTWCQEPVTR